MNSGRVSCPATKALPKLVFAHVPECLAQEVHRAALPGAAEDLGDRLLQPGVGVGDDQLHARQATLDQSTEEAAPEGFGLDYDAFISVGIPAGGTFTGAEEIKTPAQVAIYGGTAGVAYDHCYHQACDTTANLSNTALDQMSDAAAHAVLVFAQSTSAIEGTDKGKGKGHT